MLKSFIRPLRGWAEITTTNAGTGVQQAIIELPGQHGILTAYQLTFSAASYPEVRIYSRASQAAGELYKVFAVTATAQEVLAAIDPARDFENEDPDTVLLPCPARLYMVASNSAAVTIGLRLFGHVWIP